MHRFLKVPHWMIFGFCFGLPLMVKLILALKTQKVIAQTVENNEPNLLLLQEQGLENIIYVTPILLISLCLSNKAKII